MSGCFAKSYSALGIAWGVARKLPMVDAVKSCTSIG